MIQNLNKLTDPQAFIAYYFNELKAQLESNDLSASKVGALGYMLHILGNLQFDIKKYYDGLFKESFPISSLNDVNLQQHSLTFGYNFTSGVAAQLNGNIVFDFPNLPSRAVNVVKREIDLKNISMDIAGLHYVLFSKYKIIIDIINFTDYYKVRITDPLGDQKVVPISEQNPLVEINSCRQLKSETTFFNIPNYPFNSYYSIEIGLNDLDEFLESVEVLVKEYNSSNFVSFKSVRSKTFFTQTDEVVFYRVAYRNNLPVLLLELGSGKKGKYIPNSEIQVTLNKTKGVLGNIGKILYNDKIDGYLQITDYDEKGQVLYTISNSLNPEDFIAFDILEGFGGQNDLTGDPLRKNLIEFIQSRGNLINELDFKNILKKYFKHSDFLFKKTHFQDNIMNIYISLMTRYSQPEATLSKLINEKVFTEKLIESNNKKFIYYPEIVIENDTFISPFLYTFDSFLNLYKGHLTLKDQTFNLNSITKTNSSYTQIEPIFKLGLSFNSNNISTKFQVIPVIDDLSFTYKLVIPILGIMENFNSSKVYEYPNIITSKVEVHILIFNQANVQLFDVKFNDVGLVENLQDFLHLKRYFSGDDVYIVDVPLIKKDNFLNDESFYLTKLTSQLQSLSLKETRLVSDDLQLKFINSYYIPQKYASRITIQNLDFNIHLPLKINIDLILEKKYIVVNSIDVLSEVTKLRLTLANYFNDKTDSLIKIYSSQIIDLIQNQAWIKFTSIQILDSRDVKIPLSNIESIDQKSFINQITKDEVLDYCPFLWWFDINNIQINYQYFGE